jgi:hypothetical protein
MGVRGNPDPNDRPPGPPHPLNPIGRMEKATLNREPRHEQGTGTGIRIESHPSKHSKACLADSPTAPSVAVLPRRYCFF